MALQTDATPDSCAVSTKTQFIPLICQTSPSPFQVFKVRKPHVKQAPVHLIPCILNQVIY